MILDMIARLPELTEVDGSMFPLEELDDTTKGTRSWHGAGLIVLVVNNNYNVQGFIFIPWFDTSPKKLRLQRITLTPSLSGVHVAFHHRDLFTIGYLPAVLHFPNGVSLFGFAKRILLLAD